MRFIALLAFTLAFCPIAQARPVIVATTTLAADLARQVAGDQAEVLALMGPGTDPHLYKATPGDVAALRRATIVVHHGLHLEGRLSEVIESMARSGTTVVRLSDAIPEGRLLRPEGSEGQPDPHVWMDPSLWAAGATPVAKALGAADPANAEFYLATASDFVVDCVLLHEWATKAFASLPPERRILLTSHDAYHYLGRAYGLEVMGVQGISTVAEAGLGDVTRLATIIRERSLPAIFVETSVSPVTIERLARDTGVRIGGELFSDALGVPGELRPDPLGGPDNDVGTYIGMFRHNVATILHALR